MNIIAHKNWSVLWPGLCLASVIVIAPFSIFVIYFNNS